MKITFHRAMSLAAAPVLLLALGAGTAGVTAAPAAASPGQARAARFRAGVGQLYLG
jgi:hypothetical protein